MTIISADYLLVCDEAFTVLQKCALCFDNEIKEVAPLEVLVSKYPDVKVVECAPNSVLMPGLINPHVHLEFSANKTTLQYGDFITWLNSVIAHRDDLSHKCEEVCLDSVLDSMLQSGTTTIGAISSYGMDLNSCVKTPVNVIYFNEVLGSNPAAVDALYGDFLGRLEESRIYENENFIAAVSIHSPYSTHPILAKKALEISKARQMVVSTHFMESQAERDWLDSSGGEFKTFFDNFAPNVKPVNEGIAYLELFKDQKVLFTHATKANDAELDLMNALGSVTHCPVSNRLLGNGTLNINKVDHLTLGTDGLSSNNSLNMWDEMRAALMMHVRDEPNALAEKLITAATSNGAKALDKNSGTLVAGADADMITVTLPDEVENLEALALFLILHTSKAEKIYIKGKELK